MKLKKTKRNKPITKQLSEKYGGRWKYIPFKSMWICEEKDLFACYYFQGGYDMNGCPMEDTRFSLMKSLTVSGLESGSENFYPNR